MGLYERLYIGPYLQCTHRARTRTIEVRTCTNSQCAQHRRECPIETTVRFCAQCGSPVGPVSREVPSRLSFYDVVDDDTFIDLNGEDGVGGDKNLRLGSNREQAPRPFYASQNRILHEDLTDLDRGAEIRWFETTYAKEIALLRESFDNVTVRWGIHRYYH